MIVISRTEPIGDYVRGVASGAISQLSWPDLKLTIEEATAICDGHQSLPADAVRGLHESSAGWAAGLVLMLERADADAPPKQRIGLASREAVFDYFASTLFADISPAEQRTLLLASIVPALPATAASEITGDNDAHGLLEHLYRRQLFVQRLGDSAISYRWHALFREFLQAKAPAILSEEDLNAARLRAAKVMENSGEIEQAFILQRTCERWDECLRIALTHAQRLFAEGRWQTLMDWIGSFPPQLNKSSPWLEYWLGMCQFQTDQRLSRATLSDAF